MAAATRCNALPAILEKALRDMKAVNLAAADVRALASFTDHILIASGRSSRHLRALADHVLEAARQAGASVVGVEGYEHNEWILVDFGSVVVHLMQPEQREYYELERLWLDVPDRSAQ